MPPRYYNCHAHVFTAAAAPSRLQVWPLIPLARSRVTGPVLGKVLGAISPLSDVDALDRLAAFSTIGRMRDARSIFEYARQFYSDEFRFVLLPMDMTYMGAGKPKQSYEKQLEELRGVRLALGDVVYPFVAADPRRPALLDLVRRYVEEHGFAGVKLYPPLGFWPFDAALGPVYRYCVDHQLPVLTHCSRGGVFYKGRDVAQFRRHPITGAVSPARKAKDITDGLAHPANYRHVLAEYPELRLCLAHYGGGDEWHRYLRQPMPVSDRESWVRTVTDLLTNDDWPNVFADISYTAADPDFLPLIKILAQTPKLAGRILFGSDFYLVQRDTTERQFGLRVRAYVGEDVWTRIASTNPERWLGGALAARPATPKAEPAAQPVAAGGGG